MEKRVGPHYAQLGEEKSRIPAEIRQTPPRKKSDRCPSSGSRVNTEKDTPFWLDILTADCRRSFQPEMRAGPKFPSRTLAPARCPGFSGSSSRTPSSPDRK